ncbi:type IX secretion system plug protein [Namhaeicola litoreus]|uniref:DUF5103 domain-containing protein n=1 Tax=Namhaeicola litoreus TaxID=1052145 RepID=A0ABW3XYE1_9FLAO
MNLFDQNFQLIHRLTLLFFGFCSFTGIAQEIIEIAEPSHIKTVVFEANSKDTYIPVIQLGQKLSFSFDDLEGDQKIYYYRIDHCEYNWQKSSLLSTEFIAGYQEDRLRDFENSFNTLQPYTHYTLQIPNRDMQLKISGNYLLSVLDQYRNTVFTRRFIVYQPLVDVGVSVHRSRNIEYINQKQDVEFRINLGNLQVRNPYQDIQVMVLKNWDWNSALYNIPPKYVNNNQLLYNYVSEISFWGDNEYLYFDTKEIRNATNNIRQTRMLDIFNTFLYIDQERRNMPYTVYPDINGNFAVRNLDGNQSLLETDYSLVHFKLETTAELNGKDLYVFGNYNNWQIGDQNKMIYNNKTNLFELSLPFKQGFYNYLYVAADQQGKIDKKAIEGSYYQTENEYVVVVYFKQFGDRFTQVIGIGSGNSEILRN